jgi:hypothetical protein
VEFGAELFTPTGPANFGLVKGAKQSKLFITWSALAVVPLVSVLQEQAAWVDGL